MTVRGRRLVLEPGAQLEQRGEQLVLAADLGEPGVLVGEPLVLGRSAALSTRRRSISASAVAIEAAPPATSSSAPWIGRKANPMPLCTSRTAGLDENAINSRVITSSDDEGDAAAAGGACGEEGGHGRSRR